MSLDFSMASNQTARGIVRSWPASGARVRITLGIEGQVVAYDETLASRIRDTLIHKRNIKSKKMFGGVGFLLNGNMLVGVWKNSLIVRLGPDAGEAALREPHVREFDITGKAMKGWAMIEPDGVADDDQLLDWIERATEFVKDLPKK